MKWGDCMTNENIEGSGKTNWKPGNPEYYPLDTRKNGNGAGRRVDGKPDNKRVHSENARPKDFGIADKSWTD